MRAMKRDADERKIEDEKNQKKEKDANLLLSQFFADLKLLRIN